MARKNNNKRHKEHKNRNRYHHHYDNETGDAKPTNKIQTQPAKKRWKRKHASAEAVFEIAREVFGVGYCPPKEEDGQSETQG